MCCSRRKKHIYSVLLKKTQKIPTELDKMQRGVRDGSIHSWGTKKRKKKL